MPTNLAIDDNLLEEARLIGNHKTKKAVVNQALKEYIERRKQLEIVEIFGTIAYEPEHDYKVQRAKS